MNDYSYDDSNELARTNVSSNDILEHSKNKDVLNVDTLLLGLALPDCQIHSPNENYSIDNFYDGIRLNRNLIKQIGGLN